MAHMDSSGSPPASTAGRGSVRASFYEPPNGSMWWAQFRGTGKRRSPKERARSAGRPSTVHRDGRAVYVRRLGPAEEGDHLGNLRRLDETLDSGRFQYDLLDHLILGDPARAGLVGDLI